MLIMTKIRIAMLLVVALFAGWRPLQEGKTMLVRAVAAKVMNSVVHAQRYDAEPTLPDHDRCTCRRG
jgi:hypothetical protein